MNPEMKGGKSTLVCICCENNKTLFLQHLQKNNRQKKKRCKVTLENYYAASLYSKACSPPRMSY